MCFQHASFYSTPHYDNIVMVSNKPREKVSYEAILGSLDRYVWSLCIFSVIAMGIATYMFFKMEANDSINEGWSFFHEVYVRFKLGDSSLGSCVWVSFGTFLGETMLSDCQLPSKLAYK